MKIFKPILYIFVFQIMFSLILGTIFELTNIEVQYSSSFYLLLCSATAVHFIEENHYRIWILEPEIRSTEPQMDRSFFILFSHTQLITCFLFYIPISMGLFWSTIFGLSFSIMGIGNGIAHLGILAKFKKNTGLITGIFQFFFGLLVWLSLFFPQLRI